MVTLARSLPDTARALTAPHVLSVTFGGQSEARNNILLHELNIWPNKDKKGDLALTGYENVKSFFFEFETAAGSALGDSQHVAEAPKHFKG